MNLQFLLNFPNLPHPFNLAVNQPFVMGEPHVPLRDLTQSLDRRGIGRARFPEDDRARPDASRPFLRKMSAALGTYMRSEIASKLRNI